MGFTEALKLTLVFTFTTCKTENRAPIQYTDHSWFTLGMCSVSKGRESLFRGTL